MAQHKSPRLAFCRRFSSAFHGLLSSPSSGQSTSSHPRHLWTHSGSKKGSLASYPASSITPQFMAKLRKHRGIISRYSTSSGDCKSKGRQEQISGETSANSWRSPRLRLVGFGALITTAGGYFFYHSKERKSPIQARKPESTRGLLTDRKTTVGGPFKLSNHKEEVVTDQTLIGHWTLIYFGYTSCPDDCPEELRKLAEAVEKIDEQTKKKVVPVFVTIDPKRDSAAQLQAYLSEFHPRMMGLTGTVDDIRQVAREYRVFYKKVEEEGSDYLVDHSNLVYLMDPSMEFVKFFGKEYDANSLSAEVIEEIKKRGK